MHPQEIFNSTVMVLKAYTKRRATNWQTARKRQTTFTKMLPIFVPYLQALLLFARVIVNIGNFYYYVVLTILIVIPNGVTCIYKILEIH